MPTTLTDPFAAIAKPDSSSAGATTPPATGGDPFAAIAQPAAATPPAAPSSGLGEWAGRTFEGQGEEGQAGSWGDSGPGELLAGAVKSAGRGMASLIDMATGHKADAMYSAAYKHDHPDATDQEVNQAWAKDNAGTIAAKNAGHISDVANWLKSGSEPSGFWEHAGAIGEQVLEYIGTDGLLKMAGGGSAAVKGAQAGAKTVDATEHLKQAQQVATTLKSNPKLAGLVAIGLKASKDAALMGAQTYVHTEDPRQAAIAAAMGGTVSAAAGGAQSYLQKIAPRTVDVAGEKMPALASQLNEAGEPIDTGAAGAPKIAQAQQQGAQNVMRSTAAQATATALDRINRTRPVFNATEDASRMLGAGEGAEPFRFTLEGPGTVEGTEGELTSPAKQIPRTHTSLPANRTAEGTEYSRVGSEPEYIRPGEGDSASPWAERQGRSWAERRIPGHMHTGPEVEGAADMATGGGNPTTTDPMEAEGWLRQLEDIQGSREFSQLPEGQQARIEAQRKALSDQLGIYHASPYAQRFEPIDIGTATAGVRTFGDAASQIEAAARPVYTTLDNVSGGQFNKWKEAAKVAQRTMRSATDVDSYDRAAARLKQAQGEITDIIDRHRGQVSTADYMTARNAWRDSSRLDELHTNFERMMNGVTMEESDQGLTRVMTGRAKQLENYLSKGTNREQLEGLIGKEGVTNLKRITLLLSGANTARTANNVAGAVASHLGKYLGPHIEGGGVLPFLGASAGGVLAHSLGLPEWYGAIGGAAGTRAVLRMAATSPRIGAMVEYAVHNNLSAQHYAPLIARAVAEPFERPTEGEEEPDAQRTDAEPAQ